MPLRAKTLPTETEPARPEANAEKATVHVSDQEASRRYLAIAGLAHAGLVAARSGHRARDPRLILGVGLIVLATSFNLVRRIQLQRSGNV